MSQRSWRANMVSVALLLTLLVLATAALRALPATAGRAWRSKQHKPYWQLTDEITRRLRRMHVDVLRQPDLRPYDPDGVIC